MSDNMAVLDTTTRMPESFCWNCGSKSDAATGSTQPKPGDVTLCIKCGCMSIFTNDLKQRMPTDDEFCEATKIPEVRKFRAAIRKLEPSSE